MLDRPRPNVTRRAVRRASRRLASLPAAGALLAAGLALADPPAPPAAGAAKAAPTPAPDKAPAPAPAPAKAKAPASSSPEALALAARVQAFYAKVEGMSADFTQVVKKRGLKQGLRRKGKVWLKKGRVVEAQGPAAEAKVENGKMRWDYPDEEVFYYSDGDILWTYERRERVALRLAVKDSRLYQATGYLLGQGDLAADFHLAVVASPVAETLALEMVPKEGAAVMQKLTLIIDKASAAVVGSILVDPLGDSTSLFFKGLRYGPVEDKVFAWAPPPGVSVRTP
jgi:outer membrane lipoprotein-sorting protein